MLGVYDFLGSEGASIGAAFPFMLLENPDSQMRAKRRDRRGGKGKRPHSGEQTRWLREGCRKKNRKNCVLLTNQGGREVKKKKKRQTSSLEKYFFSEHVESF